ncbi:Intracellular endo-alpha-(1-_5)-L-arabinanase [Posidoniimonas corsicana]|uniref:Intracellular endo-alpha-(1->5)-L-arabinanase n=1 Tax=Posidoniimonas corsicana TaxID=1938618 RepID=A0A5C5VDR8_9BACT|nr:arabinan endo-1,5-alpha-L-arabinosidase [Posidoniimonas corsicana]TWT36087.1 Intracellular endo-alpha-(1->5)-L-arabinanase [Posidoniimonas corsicana]
MTTHVPRTCLRAPLLLLGLLAAGSPAHLTAQTSAREGLLNGAPDPTGVAVKNDAGETVYYVAATGQGVQLLRSTDLARWEPAGRVFHAPVPEWAARAVPGTQGIWAPDLSYHDGLFYLYYSVSTFGSQHSVIGLAVNKSLEPGHPDNKWEDRGQVISSDAAETDFNAIDPALLVDQQGKWWLFWGSHWAGLKAVEVDPSTGKPKDGAEVLAVAARPDTRSHAIEAPFVIFHDGYYYQFVSWDSCCDGAKSTYKVMVGRSKQPTGPYADADGKPMLEGGGTLVLENSERWRGPGHNGVITTDQGQWMVHHTYDVENLDAQRILQVRPLTWTKEGWPRVGEPVAAP